jgi:hypothetical protein
MSCTICQHPQRQAIDQALVAGSATLANLSQQYNLSTSALHRHKAHLKAKVSRAQTQLQDNLRQGCIFWLSQAIDLAMQTAKAAQAEGNSRLVLQALAQGTRLVTIILKQDLNLDDRLIYEILANPQWASQDSLLPADPNIMSLSRQSLAATLSSPCPEIVSQNSNAVSQENPDLYQENPSGPARTHPPKLRTSYSINESFSTCSELPITPDRRPPPPLARKDNYRRNRENSNYVPHIAWSSWGSAKSDRIAAYRKFHSPSLAPVEPA